MIYHHEKSNDSGLTFCKGKNKFCNKKTKKFGIFLRIHLLNFDFMFIFYPVQKYNTLFRLLTEYK